MSAGISISGSGITVSDAGTYLIIYDVKTSNSNVVIVQLSYELDTNIVSGSPIGFVAPRETETFVSYNRVFLAYLSPLKLYLVGVFNDGFTAVNILGGINSPQILIVRVA